MIEKDVDDDGSAMMVLPCETKGRGRLDVSSKIIVVKDENSKKIVGALSKW